MEVFLGAFLFVTMLLFPHMLLASSFASYLPPEFSLADCGALGSLTTTYSQGFYNPTTPNEERDRALQRMQQSRHELRDLVEAHDSQSRPVLEVGALYTPVFDLSNREDVFLWDMDVDALSSLEQTALESTQFQWIDFNSRRTNHLGAFKNWTRRLLAAAKRPDDSFSLAVVSQVLNYVNPFVLITLVAEFQKFGDKIIISNHINHGDEDVLSAFRPRNAREILDLLVGAGYQIQKSQIEQGVELPGSEFSDERLMVVAVKTRPGTVRGLSP